MDNSILGQNIRRLRNAKGMSQKALAEAAGLSLPEIKNLESAKYEPRVSTLQAIAKALGVRFKDLFMPVRELKTVRFRSTKRVQNRQNILADVSRWLDDFNFLEEILNDRKSFKLRMFDGPYSKEKIISIANQCRNILDLKQKEPIHDICGLLEDAGIKVYLITYNSDSFFGLSIADDDGGPAIVVNNWDRISVERQIFSAAHELGHLILHKKAYDVDQTEENEKEENESNLFASHFLMPAEGFNKEWNETAGHHWVYRVLKVKRIFRVSYKTVLMRLIESGAANDSVWKDFAIAYQKLFNRKLLFKEEPMGVESTEPSKLERFDFFEDRFSRLVRQAIKAELITLSRGAEILRIGVEEMRVLLRNWEAVHEQSSLSK